MDLFAPGLDPSLVPAVRAMLATQRHSWEQGVVMQALDAIGLNDQLDALAYQAVVATAATDGRVAALHGPDLGSATDPCACGLPLARVLERTGDPLFARALAGLEDWALRAAPRNADGVVYHEVERPRIWVDSFFMLPPFLAGRGHFDLAYQQIQGYWSVLHDDSTGLLFHMWDEASGRVEWRNLWATGNGWALAGLAQVIDRWPADRPEVRADLVAKANSLLAALAAYQRPDGLFHNFVDRPYTFTDAAGGCLAAYAAYLGRAAGWIEPAGLALADKARAAAEAHIGPYGFVEPVVGAQTFDRPGISAEAQAAYLLMQAAAGQA
jgi:rhamnogalacturonyl hydrolase YesR